jgi:hypothetical protein
MKTSARCAAGLLILFLLSGCYSTRITRSESASPHPPTNWEDVRVYGYEAAAPPHEVLGEVYVKGEAELLKESFQEALFRHKAAEMGANGVILLYGPQPGGAARVVSKIIPGVVYRESKALAIYVPQP